MWVYENVRSILRYCFCHYMKIAQVATVGKEVVAGKGTLGRRILKGVVKFFTFAFLTSLLARECSLVPLLPEGKEIVTLPSPVPVVPPVTLTYTATARLWLLATEKFPRKVTVPIHYAVGRVALKVSESVTRPVGYYATARVTLESYETVARPVRVEPVPVPASAILASVDVSVSAVQYSATGSVVLLASESASLGVTGFGIVPNSSVIASASLQVA